MKAARHLGQLILRRLTLRRLARIARRRPPLPDADADLLALAEEFADNDRRLRRLLDGDGRDTEDIPGFSDLADRQAELVARIAGAPARGVAGLIAKARCARLIPAESGFDAAAALSLSLADDLLRLAQSAALPSPLSASDPSCSSVGASPRQMKEQFMNDDSERRLAALRHNALLRQTTDALIMVGAFAIVALIALPVNGVGLTLIGFAVLVVTSIASIGLAFFLLRFIDHTA